MVDLYIACTTSFLNVSLYVLEAGVERDLGNTSGPLLITREAGFDKRRCLPKTSKGALALNREAVAVKRNRTYIAPTTVFPEI